ncbi:MAG TPA: ATP-binding protein [Tenuifilaceae bacterium]|nr:ATP-binding protein [Tenuifilaceae bacterium]
MKKKFVFGAILSILLITVNQVLIQYALHQKRQDSDIINLSGRQRMLSQRIALKFYQFSQNQCTIREIEGYVENWKKAHSKLLVASSRSTLFVFAGPMQNKIMYDLEQLSPRIDFVGKQLKNYKYHKQIDIAAIVDNQEAFLVKMDNIVAEFADYSDQKLVVIIILELILAALSIIVILLEVRYIYYPQAKALEKSLTKNLQEEKILAQTNHLLDIKNKELEQFNYIVSHDLKEPLRTVSNYIQIIEEDYAKQLDEEIKHHLKIIGNASNRMESLIIALLDYSRLGKGRKLSLCSCNQILRDVLSDLHNLVKTSCAKVQVGELPEVYAYEVELRQLFQNLISNAIKFRKKDIDPIIKIDASNTDGSYEFSVSDNGIGIEPKHFEKIFSVFQRLHSAKEYEGQGIGLANCKKIVELHNGKIWVESEYNVGSTFKFTIPSIQP